MWFKVATNGQRKGLHLQFLQESGLVRQEGEGKEARRRVLVVLHSADLNRVGLVAASLPGTSLFGANLRGADLLDVRLSGADLFLALPDGTMHE